jgi:hypothetical protein
VTVVDIETGPTGFQRWYRPVMFGLSVAVLIAGLLLFLRAVTGAFGGYWGVDITHYLDGARRWLETGTPYLASEVAGPFEYQPQTFMHPPIALLLFVPFLWLPIVLWWLVPLAVTLAIVVACRPAPWTWPLLALAAAYPRFHAALIVGNSDLWVLAGIAAGLVLGWPALVIVVKPTLLFLAAAGVRHRSWWLGWVVVAVMCVPFGTLWSDWIAVVVNSPGDWTYSLHNVPYLLAPLIAWLGRTAMRRGWAG